MSLFSFKSIPDGIEAIRNFDRNKYLGKWYEIARIDFRYEKNLNNTTAEYAVRPDGKISVINRGFNYKKNKWEKAVGKAKFAGNTDVAMLRVSFFGPFYAGYNVIKIDPGYNYSLVCGKDFNYLWILSRTSAIPNAVREEYLDFARKAGFDISRLTWVEHNK